jgi:hypothetical protein
MHGHTRCCTRIFPIKSGSGEANEPNAGLWVRMVQQQQQKGKKKGNKNRHQETSERYSVSRNLVSCFLLWFGSTNWFCRIIFPPPVPLIATRWCRSWSLRHDPDFWYKWARKRRDENFLLMTATSAMSASLSACYSEIRLRESAWLSLPQTVRLLFEFILCSRQGVRILFFLEKTNHRATAFVWTPSLEQLYKFASIVSRGRQRYTHASVVDDYD